MEERYKIELPTDVTICPATRHGGVVSNHLTIKGDIFNIVGLISILTSNKRIEQLLNVTIDGQDAPNVTNWYDYEVHWEGKTIIKMFFATEEPAIYEVSLLAECFDELDFEYKYGCCYCEGNISFSHGIPGEIKDRRNQAWSLGLDGRRITIPQKTACINYKEDKELPF